MKKEQKEVGGYQFDDKRHRHTYDGKSLTGVTTVLGVVSKGDSLIQWSANCASDYLSNNIKECLGLVKEKDTDIHHEVIIWDKFKEICEKAKKAWVTTRDSAGDSGKEVHAIIEELIKNAIKFSNGQILSGVNENKQVQNFIDWSIQNKVRFLESEKNVYSLSLWIGGIVDFVCEINGEIFVGDIKTAKSIYPTNFWQTSAYQFCLQEMGLYPNIKGFKIVRLGKDGTFEVADNYTYDKNIKGFQSALTVYRMLNEINK